MMAKTPLIKNPTLRRTLWIVGGVIALALVIFGLAAITAPKRATQPTQIELSPAQQAEQLAVSADVAASKDETATARTLAEKALTLDANNATAKAVISKLDKAAAAKPATTTKPTTTTTTTPPPAASDVYVEGVKDVKVLLPGDIAGWSKGTVSVQGGEGLVTYEPAVTSPAFPSAVRVTFNVHDFKDGGKATAFSTGTVKRVYPQDGAEIRVASASGYTGTDGARLAVVSFSRGRYAFEVLIYGKPNATAAQMKALALQLADALPAAH